MNHMRINKNKRKYVTAYDRPADKEFYDPDNQKDKHDARNRESHLS